MAQNRGNQPNYDDKSNLEKLQEGLYSREGSPVVNSRRSRFSDARHDEVESSWDSDNRLQSLLSKASSGSGKGSFLKKLLLVSFLFFAVSVAVASFIFLKGSNVVSPNNISISVLGPVSTGGGDELVLDIIIQNDNNVKLEDADLLVEYPPGTRVASDIQKELLRHRESLGEIPAGGLARRTVKAVLFGEKDDIKEIAVKVEYRIPGSSGLFEKRKIYELAIKSSPVVVVVSGPSEVNSNQNVEFVATITSNSSATIQDLLFSAEYPFGFSFESASPRSSFGNNVWQIGNLKPGEKRQITIRGTMEGQENEERTFRWNAGVQSEEDEKEIGAGFVSLLQSVVIRKPQITLEVALNGSQAEEYVASVGGRVQGTVVFKNNLSDKIVNGRVEVKLRGAILNKSSVSVSDGGFYQSSSDTITWTQSSTQKLAEINPGESRDLSFSFQTLNSGSLNTPPEVSVDVSVSGSRLGENSSPSQISSSLSRLVKLASSMDLTSRIVHSVGPFANSGPIPPKAEETTTYTVIWSLSNSLNDVSDARVRATLPPYVEWRNTVSPSETITFNPLTREVIWEAGEVRAGAGRTSAPREAAFQIGFEPSLNQVGSTPTLVGAASVSGRDRFTGSSVEDSAPLLSTQLATDPAFNPGDERVVQ